ncbi:MAG: hypothetical protein FWC51_04985 [Proteobacteria bacterium]|nr:hypothetical protein [Pseudomonadota bacterium]
MTIKTAVEKEKFYNAATKEKALRAAALDLGNRARNDQLVHWVIKLREHYLIEYRNDVASYGDLDCLYPSAGKCGIFHDFIYIMVDQDAVWKPMSIPKNTNTGFHRYDETFSGAKVDWTDDQFLHRGITVPYKSAQPYHLDIKNFIPTDIIDLGRKFDINILEKVNQRDARL